MEALIFLLATIIATSHSSSAFPDPNHLVMPHSGVATNPIARVDCLSWRLAIETNNLQDWGLVPRACFNYVREYMLGKQYGNDCDMVAEAAFQYAQSLKLAGDGKDIWVFDVDETALSNLVFFSRPDAEFGTRTLNVTRYFKWSQAREAEAIPAVLKLYERLLLLGFKIVFLTGYPAPLRPIRERNLRNVGYHTWEKLILKPTSETSTSAVIFKSQKRKEVEEEGYRILGNMGDQWSDLTGTNVGNRTFKVPNPMYYIG